MFIKKLNPDVVIITEFGTQTLTHEGVEFVISAQAGGFVKATLWQGVVKPGTVTDTDLTPDPVFVPYEPSRQEKLIAITELRPLRAAKGGKSKEDFKMSDIYNLIFKGVAP